jgi:hypothetical protein
MLASPTAASPASLVDVSCPTRSTVKEVVPDLHKNIQSLAIDLTEGNACSDAAREATS